MAQYEGKVQWFNNAKGYGFLSRNDGGVDVFIHFSSIHAEGYKTLKEGDLVSFSIIIGDKGKPQAADVQLLISDSIPPAILTAPDIERGIS